MNKTSYQPIDILAVYALHEISHREHFAGVLKFCNKRPNWRLHIKEPGNDFTADDVLGTKGSKYDGFIISLPGTDDAMQSLARSTTPTVLVNITDRQLANREQNLSTVWLDNADIGRCGAKHLLQQNDFRSYAFLLAADGQFYSRERETAFRETITKAGYRSNQLTVPQGDEAVSIVGKWLKRLPTPIAVMCAEAKAALVCHNACKQFNLKIPEQVALLSVNDNPAYMGTSGLSISCVLPDVAEMGYRAAEELDRIIRSKGRHKFREIVIPVSTVLTRTSTKFSRTSAQMVKTALEFIQANADKPLHVTDIVNKLGVSRRLLETSFNQFNDLSIREEIEKTRMKAALTLLKQGKSVQKVAKILHFKTPNALTRAYKRHFAQSIRESLPRNI